MALACLPIFAACSNGAEIRSAPPVYVGIPAGLMDRCTVQDVPLETVGDLVLSRERYIERFETCAARVDAIREHDRQARQAIGRD